MARNIDLLNATKEQIREYAKDIAKSYQPNSVERQNDALAWMYYYNNHRESDFSYLTKYGDYELPAKLVHLPLQSIYINRLVSESMLRPFPIKMRVADDRGIKERRGQEFDAALQQRISIAKSGIMQKKAQVLKLAQSVQQLQQFISREPQTSQEKQQIEEVAAQLPLVKLQIEEITKQLQESIIKDEEATSRIDSWLNQKFESTYEEAASYVLEDLKVELRIDDIRKDAFKNKVVTGKKCYFVYYKEGELYPRLKVVSAEDVSYPSYKDLKWVDEGPWVAITDYYPYQDIVGEYGGEFEKKHGKETLRRLGDKDYSSSNRQGRFVGTHRGGIDPGIDMSQHGAPLSYSGERQSSGIKVVKVWIRVPKEAKIKYKPSKENPGEFLRYLLDHNDIPVNSALYQYSNKENGYIPRDRTYSKMEVVPEDKAEVYRPNKGEKIVKRYTNNVYSCVIIDDQYVVCEKINESIIRSPHKHFMPYLPVIARAYNGYDSVPHSLILATKTLQDTYNIIEYHRQVMLALAGTKTLLIDESQKVDGQSEEERDLEIKTGKFRIQSTDEYGNPRQFNQFQAIDLSLSNSIQYFDNMLQNIRDTMGIMMGLSRESMGQTLQYDSVGTTNNAIQQSAMITELTFHESEEEDARMIERILNIATKYCYNTGRVVQLMDHEDRAIFHNIPKGIFDDRHFRIRGYVNGSEQRKMMEAKQILMSQRDLGLSATAMMDMFDSKTLVELKRKSKYYEEKAMKLRQEIAKSEGESQRQAQQEAIQLQQNFQMELKKIEQQSKEREDQLKKYIEDMKAAIASRANDLKEKEIDLNAILKTQELAMEKESEDNAVNFNRESLYVNTNLKQAELKVNALLAQLGEYEETKRKKIDATAKRMNKEHVSDK